MLMPQNVCSHWKVPDDVSRHVNEGGTLYITRALLASMRFSGRCMDRLAAANEVEVIGSVDHCDTSNEMPLVSEHEMRRHTRREGERYSHTAKLFVWDVGSRQAHLPSSFCQHLHDITELNELFLLLLFPSRTLQLQLPKTNPSLPFTKYYLRRCYTTREKPGRAPAVHRRFDNRGCSPPSLPFASHNHVGIPQAGSKPCAAVGSAGGCAAAYFTQPYRLLRHILPTRQMLSGDSGPSKPVQWAKLRVREGEPGTTHASATLHGAGSHLSRWTDSQ
ncbi:hypothetical protein VFPPC_05555 [Pochonia chlamydosporia 170]|uniref:Uncharacterized protein n=1 Tax=Pochonia chlamydosporia 170 TaxID=1380566 RepID=A0A179FFX5_METCM|nr:hypothetical protein VFPPC_05555 [Pochonia chlamydosporia 170]OAQ64248.2 hypothetical protein VFPPC_05555 [Pochonia chlamydosporia 170]